MILEFESTGNKLDLSKLNSFNIKKMHSNTIDIIDRTELEISSGADTEECHQVINDAELIKNTIELHYTEHLI